MSDSIFVFFIIFITAGMIYLLYKIMLGSEKEKKEDELQITSNEILEQLHILHKQRKNNIVESLAKNYLKKKGSDEGVRTILARTLYESGKISEAIDQAKIIIGHSSDNLSMKVFLANCYFELGKSTQAIVTFQEILENEPDNVIAIKELAEIYLHTNQKKSAVKMFKKLEAFLENNQEIVKHKLYLQKFIQNLKNLIQLFENMSKS